MDRLEAMSILIATIEAGSFSGASRTLGVPLPTVSRKVSDLEAHLGTRILVRSTRKLTLTDAGAAYVAACKRILDQVGEAESVVGGEFSVPKGELVVTAPIVFGRLHVVPLVNEFLIEFPEINVRMMLADRNVNLVDDHVDLAVRIGPLPDSTMVATRVGAVHRVVCGSPDYFAANAKPKAPGDLAGLTCVTFSGLSAASSWTFKEPGRGLVQATPPRCRLNVNTAEAAIDSALDGVGVTHVLSYQVARFVADGRLIPVLTEYEVDELPVHLVHAGQGLLPLKMRRFLDFAVPRLRGTLSGEPF